MPNQQHPAPRGIVRNRAPLWAASVVTGIIAATSFAIGAGPQVRGVASTVFLTTALLTCMTRWPVWDASFVFLAFSVLYLALLPILYATGAVRVNQGDFLVHSWDLLARENLISSVGLGAFLIGVRLGRRGRRRRRLRRPVGLDVRLAITLLLGVAAVSWFVMFVKAGMPTSSLLGRPPFDRARVQSFTAGGYGYLLDFGFGSYLALVVYLLRRSKVMWWSPPVVVLVAAAYVFNGMVGSRLILVMTILTVVFVQLLPGRTLASPRQWRIKNRRLLIRLVVVSVLLFGLATAYRGYRNNESLSGQFLANAMNTFDTASTYPLVLERVPSEVPYWNGRSAYAPILLRIPTPLLRDKYERLWADARFTQQFYGYDQNQSGTVARSPSFLALAWLNGGYLGVIGMMLAMGYVCERLSGRMRTGDASIPRTVAYVVFVLFFIPFAHKSGLASAVTYVDAKLLLLLGVVLASSRRLGPARDLRVEAHKPMRARSVSSTLRSS